MKLNIEIETNIEIGTKMNIFLFPLFINVPVRRFWRTPHVRGGSTKTWRSRRTFFGSANGTFAKHDRLGTLGVVERCERAREGPTLPRAVVPLAREYTTCTTAANVHFQRMAAAAAIRRFKINWRQLAERPLDVLRGRPQTFRTSGSLNGSAVA